MDQDKKHDKFCWECCTKGTNLIYCQSCPRSFHPKCVLNETCTINLQASISIFRICSACKKLETAKNTKDELQRIPIIFDRVYSKCVDLIKTHRKNAKRMKMNTEPISEIINPIDLMQIKTKVEADMYTSLSEFLVDFQWFAHNYEIMYTNNDEKTKRAKKLLQLVVAEIDSVKTCLECHINANTSETRSHWFTMVHRVPHLIIWAQRKNARYWPAKVMSFDEQCVNVRFFGGDHKHENVSVNKCYLYSKSSPTNRSIRPNDTEFESALREAEQYIKNICEKYGAFELAEAKTMFDPASHNEYIQNLISAVGKSPAQNGANNLHKSMTSTPKNQPSSVRTVKAEPTECGTDSDDSMEIMAENPPQSIKYEPPISIYDAPEIVEESITGLFENNNEDIEVESSDFDVRAMNRSLEHFTKGFRSICKRNEKIKKQLESAVESETKLMNENQQLKIEMEALKEAHDQEMNQLKEERDRLIEQQKLAMEQCKQECSQRIEEAKSNKYCMCCDTPKPLDYYICGIECQKINWESTSN